MRTEEENKKIIEEFPFLRDMYWDRYSQKYKYDYDSTILDEVPNGWADLMLCMAEDIKPLLEESGQLNKFFSLETKEKFGGLRLYHNGECPKEVEEIIFDYSVLSSNVCVMCGKPDSLFLDFGWIGPICVDCYSDKPLWYKTLERQSEDDEDPCRMAEYRYWKAYDNENKCYTEHSRYIGDKAEKIRKRYASTN